jgi:hypothetical protein
MEEEYVSITEAARRVGKSDKQVRHWVQSGKLTARYLPRHRAEIAVKDLEPFLPEPLPGQVNDLNERVFKRRLAPLEERLAEVSQENTRLKQRLADVEQSRGDLFDQVMRLTERTHNLQMRLDSLEEQFRAWKSSPVPEPAPEEQGESVPPDVLLTDFADLHAINRNESERRWKAGFIAGKKIQTQRRQTIVLEAKGQHDFWVQFHKKPGFRTCDHCPHEMKGGSGYTQ